MFTEFLPGATVLDKVIIIRKTTYPRTQTGFPGEFVGGQGKPSLKKGEGLF
jgi:hypothetical protein